MNNIVKALRVSIITATLLLTASPIAQAQEKRTQDTLECHIIGFSVSPVMPDGLFSYSKAEDGTSHDWNTLESLYKGPYLDFGVNTTYKYKSNWLVSIDGDMWFGSDNLQDRQQHMQGVYTSTGLVIAENGTDGVYTCYNRGFSLKAGLGKVFVTDKRNPNSGILAKVSAGWMTHKTVFNQDYTESAASQLAGDYLKLYDKRRTGLILSEDIGYWFMSNRLNLVNFYAAFEISQMWTRSARDYQIDTYPETLGEQALRGPDNDRHFDMLYTLKLCWMFPLKGKTVYDFYYY